MKPVHWAILAAGGFVAYEAYQWWMGTQAIYTPPGSGPFTLPGQSGGPTAPGTPPPAGAPPAAANPSTTPPSGGTALQILPSQPSGAIGLIGGNLSNGTIKNAAIGKALAFHQAAYMAVPVTPQSI